MLNSKGQPTGDTALLSLGKMNPKKRIDKCLCISESSSCTAETQYQKSTLLQNKTTMNAQKKEIVLNWTLNIIKIT